MPVMAIMKLTDKYGCKMLIGTLLPVKPIEEGDSAVLGAVVVYVLSCDALGPEPVDGPADR